MRLLAGVLIVLVALAHLGFLVLEMFFWDHPVGRKIFSMTPEVSASSAVLPRNQGLYNGFLAAGLLWGLVAGRRDVKIFFLGCVFYQALTQLAATQEVGTITEVTSPDDNLQAVFKYLVRQ